MNKLPYLNLGCGTSFSEKWFNIDFSSSNKNVTAHNLLSGIPFKDETFEVVYHSHVLEHFTQNDAINLISECNRVLVKGGIIRIAVPDLETIAKNYIKYLDECLKNTVGAEEKYRWTLLELFDQTIRTKSGGEMVNYIKDESRNNDAFLLERNGQETRLLIENIRKNNLTKTHNLSVFSKIKNSIKKIVFKDNIKALEIGKFRLGGEIHQWMYDRYSLSKLLEKNGFTNFKVVTATTSSIPNWNSFELDSIGNAVRKPDSLFVEATKIND